MKSHVHALNNSPAKQKYSFSKDQRFKYDKPQTDVYYLPKFQRDRRSALIGYGQRSLGMLHQKSYQSTPHSYNIPSLLEQKKGYAFKGGRYEIGGYLENLKEKKIIPGPNSYLSPSTLQKNGVTLKPKLPDFSLKYLESVPGPGSYSVPTTLRGSQNERGIMDSKFTNPGMVKLSNSLDLSRRKQPISYIPGPGQYDIAKYGIGNPENPLVRNQNVKFPLSGRPRPEVKGADKIPGPGEYKIYSQFD